MKQYAHLILPYIDKSQRERIKTLIQSEKGRVKLQQQLSHKVKLNKKLSRQLRPDEQQFDVIHRLLTSSKEETTDFFIVSENPEINRQVMPLDKALNNIYAAGYTAIIVSLNGNIGYYETEGKNARYLLSKTRSNS